MHPRSIQRLETPGCRLWAHLDPDLHIGRHQWGNGLAGRGVPLGAAAGGGIVCDQRAVEYQPLHTL